MIPQWPSCPDLGGGVFPALQGTLLGMGWRGAGEELWCSCHFECAFCGARKKQGVASCLPSLEKPRASWTRVTSDGRQGPS